MLTSRKFAVAAALVGCCVSLAACAWPFGTNGPKDLRVVSVSAADFRDQTQLEYVGQTPRPSIPLSRIEFSTDTDLLALARKHQYNITFAIGPCSKDGVVDNGTGFGYVYWGTAVINAYTKDSAIPGYMEAAAKGAPFTYQVYAKRLPANPPAPVCIAVRGATCLAGSSVQMMRQSLTNHRSVAGSAFTRAPISSEARISFPSASSHRPTHLALTRSERGAFLE